MKVSYRHFHKSKQSVKEATFSTLPLPLRFQMSLPRLSKSTSFIEAAIATIFTPVFYSSEFNMLKLFRLSGKTERALDFDDGINIRA